MEFTNLSRYMKVTNPGILPFENLRKMEPLKMTQGLQIWDDPINLELANRYASQGMKVVPIRRQPPFSKFLDRTSFPRRILFEMTSNCNFRCRMCPQLNLKRPRMDMEGELYRKVIDEIDSHGIEGIWLYHLGESLLHPDFQQNLAHISTKKNLGIIWMSTNGQYFTEEFAKSVLSSNVDYINFSMHAVTEATYQTVTKQGDFKTVRGNLERFYELKGATNSPRRPFIHTQMIEQETTRHETDKFIFEHHEKADIVSINMLEYVNMPNNTFGLNQRERKPLTSCLRVERNDCFICSNGSVTLCDAAYNGEILLGDVNKQTLFEIWNGEERRRVLELNDQGRMGENEFCRTCTDYDI